MELDAELEIQRDDDFEVVPEPEHLEFAFQALEDTVSGSESLTSAQLYMQSVLLASGKATRAQVVTGVEGFFSKIGDGLKAIWEYIQKMFKSIWNWFFGKKEKGTDFIADAEARLKANQASMAAMAGAHYANAEAIKAQFKGLDEVLSNIKSELSGSQKAEAEKAQEMLRLEYSKSSHDKMNPKVAKEVAEIILKLHPHALTVLEKVSAEAVEQYEGYIKLVHYDHSAKFTGTQFEDVYKNYHNIFTSNLDTKIVGYLKIPKINSVSTAQRAQEDLAKALKELDSEKGSLSVGFKAGAISKIKKLQEQVNRPDMTDDNRAKFRKDLEACKLFLSLTTQVIKQIERTTATIVRMDAMIMRACGMKSARA